jgi:3-carboxy-cis,cis-muconate cycloisomerase
VNDVGLLDPLAQGTRALELTDDAAFLAAMVETELALARALVDVGVAPDWMLAVCNALGVPDVSLLAAGSRAGGNPVIPLVAHLTAAADAVPPGAGDHVHVGATSQDILDTASMLVARSVCFEVVARLREVGAALAELAQEHRSTPMVGRTLGQHASPTTFGFVVAGWLDSVTSAIAAVDAARIALPLQFGGAVGTRATLDRVAAKHGATADTVVAALADRLGLAAPAVAWHGNRAPVLALAAALARAVAAVGVIAVDVTVLARTEIAEVAERVVDGSGGSSAMPHKTNPVTAVLVTAAARRAPHALGAVFAAALSEDQRASGAWHAEWMPLRDLERTAVSACSGAVTLVERLEVDETRMAANLTLTAGLVDSERLVAALSDVMPHGEAFALVRRAADDVSETGVTLRQAIALLTDGDARLAAERGLDDRDGGSASDAIGRVIAEFGATVTSTSIAEER